MEVDIPEMVTWKEQLLARSEDGRRALERTHWRRIGADVRSLSLPSLTEGGERVLVVAEGLLMYLDAEAQRALFRRVFDLLQRAGGELLFDLVPPAEEPPPGILGAALGWLMRRFTKGAGFVQGKRTRQEVLRDLEAAGFDVVTAIEPAAVAGELGLPYPTTWTRQLVFRAAVAAGSVGG